MSDSNYSILDEVFNLGGTLRRTIDISAWISHADQVESQASEVGAEVPAVQDTAPLEPAPLSTVHKRPFLLYRAGASFLKSSRAIPGEAPKGGKKNAIAGFSRSSRRRLMLTIGGVRRDAELPAFVTLTYPESFPDPKTSKRHLDIFIRRWRRKFPNSGMIWKLEPQERGAPHYHLLVWNCNLLELQKFTVNAWFDIAGNGDEKHKLFHMGMFGNEHCVQQVRTFQGVLNYAAKYLGKTFDVSGWSEKWTGRYWAVVNREGIPFGEERTLETSSRKAIEIIRYGRRFAGLPGRDYKSLTFFCDAEQWVKNLFQEEVATRDKST